MEAVTRISSDGKIKFFFEKNEFITNADVRYLFAASPATANRILAEPVKKKKITEDTKIGTPCLRA